MRFLVPILGLVIGYVVCATFGLGGAVALVAIGIAYAGVWAWREGHGRRC